MSDTFENKLGEMDQLVKEAKLAEVREWIAKLSRGDIPRRFLGQTARLATRAGAPREATLFLHPVVRGTGTTGTSATEKERLEYSLALIRLGARSEASTLLSSINSANEPEVLLFQAFNYFSAWEYEAAIPALRQYLASSKIDSYQRTIGETNLAASLVHERRCSEADEIISRLLSKLGERERLMVGHTLQLAAENAIYQREWTEAERYLCRAESSHRSSDSLNRFFLKKLRVLLEVMKEGPGPKQVSKVLELTKEAQDLRHWESIRDCERLLAITSHDKELFLKVFFGTPYDNFRKWMKFDLPEFTGIPENYLWKPEGEGPVLDLESGEFKEGQSLETGRLPHKLLVALCRDFYRPFSAAALHSELYPKTYFNPQSSIAKIYFLKTQVRQWIFSNRLPLELHAAKGALRLRVTGPVTLKIRRESSCNRRELLLDKMRAGFLGKEFSAREATSLLKLSKRSIHGLLNEAKGVGAVLERGSGAFKRYAFVGARK